MYKLHNYVNGSAPAINASNLNDMDLGIASGCTYMATCGSAASSIAKAITIQDFETNIMTASPGIPFVLYVMFTNGSSSATMTISINSGSARSVKYHNSVSNINALSIGANDVVAFVYNGGYYHLLGAISMPISLIDVAHGGTGRNTLTQNALLSGNGADQVKLIPTVSGALFSSGTNSAPTFGTLPVAQGGTGATSSENARANLEIPTIYIGTGDPSTGIGRNGDIYFKYTA